MVVNRRERERERGGGGGSEGKKGVEKTVKTEGKTFVATNTCLSRQK